MHTSIVRALFSVAILLLTALSACSPPGGQPAASASNAEVATENSTDSRAKSEERAQSEKAERGAVLTTVREKKTLRVGMTGDQAPFNMTDKAGVLIGFEVDLCRALAAALEVELELVKKPFGELLPAVNSGEIDIAMSSITMTPKRNIDVAFIGPYFVSGKALLSKNATLAAAQKGQLNVQTVKLGATKGSTSELFVQRVTPAAQLVPLESYDAGVKAVAEGKVDGFVADLPMVAVTLLQNPDQGFAAVGEPLSFEPIGIALPPGDAHFVNLVGNYMNLLEGTGLIDLLRAKWFGNADWLKELPATSFGKPHDPGARFDYGAPNTI